MTEREHDVLAPVRRFEKLVTGIWSAGSSEENEFVGAKKRAGFTQMASTYKILIS